MSMLHSIVYASRLVRQDLQRRRLSGWPGGTTVSTRDLLLQRRSLTDLAQAHGTSWALTSQVGSSEQTDGPRTVVLATILRRVEGRHRRPDEITVDCDLRGIRAQCLDALLLNSSRALARTPMLVHPRDRQSSPLQLSLPGDTSPGDLLALVCRGIIAADQTRLDNSCTDSDDDDGRGRCMK